MADDAEHLFDALEGFDRERWLDILEKVTAMALFQLDIRSLPETFAANVND